MPDALVEFFEGILDDPTARASTKVNAARELARLRASQPEKKSPLGVMQAIVEQYAPQTPEERDLPPDPMRALDFEAATGRTLDPVAFSWLPYWPLRGDSVSAWGRIQRLRKMTFPGGVRSA